MRTVLPLLLLVAICLPAHAQGQKTLTFVADEWCPYNCEPGTTPEGFAVELARLIYGEAGYEVKYLSIPWTRALHDVAQGDFDAVIAATGNEAPGLIYPVEPCGISTNAFFTRIGSPWRWEGFNSLSAMRTAFIRDYDYGREYDRYIAENKNTSKVIISVEDDALIKNLQLLAKGRVDLVVEDLNVGCYTMQLLGLGDVIELNGTEGEAEPVFLAFSPRHPHARRLAALYDEGIEKLRSSGELARILARYGLKDWK